MRLSFRSHSSFLDLAGDDLEVYYEGWATEDEREYVATERERSVREKGGGRVEGVLPSQIKND